MLGLNVVSNDGVSSGPPPQVASGRSEGLWFEGVRSAQVEIGEVVSQLRFEGQLANPHELREDPSGALQNAEKAAIQEYGSREVQIGGLKYGFEREEPFLGDGRLFVWRSEVFEHRGVRCTYAIRVFAGNSVYEAGQVHHVALDSPGFSSSPQTNGYLNWVAGGQGLDDA